MTQITDNVYAVEVPDNTVHVEIYDKESLPVAIMVYTEDKHKLFKPGIPFPIPLPSGNWKILCTTRECTEERAASIVQVISNGKISGRPQYRRYDRDPVKDTPAKSWTRDPRHALETLLTSKGLDENKNYALLKKKVK